MTLSDAMGGELLAEDKTANLDDDLPPLDYD